MDKAVCKSSECFEDVSSINLAGIYKELAETIGVENAYKIYSHFKGMQLMFPLKFYAPEYTAKKIVREYDNGNGKTIHELVREYGLSESRVRQILRGYHSSE